MIVSVYTTARMSSLVGTFGQLATLTSRVQTLRTATKNFLPDGRLIAVKKLSLEKSQQGEREFLPEDKELSRFIFLSLNLAAEKTLIQQPEVMMEAAHNKL